ncbi:MAG: hypothetical protein AAFW84_21340 [Cyanobacteria bacterium J06635_15]
MPIEVLEAEIIDTAPYIEGLDNSVGGQIEVYTPPVQQAPAAKYGNTIPSSDRGLDGLVDSKGRPLTYRGANGVEQWNRDYEFDDIPDYGTPEFSDWANGADLDPEAFDNFADRNRAGVGARALDALEGVGVVLDIAQGIWDTPARYAEGRDLFQDAFPGVPGLDVLGGFVGAFAPTYPLLGVLDFILPGSPDGLPSTSQIQSIGQPGINYFVTIRGRERDGGTKNIVINCGGGIIGPITGADIEQDGSSRARVTINHGGGTLEFSDSRWGPTSGERFKEIIDIKLSACDGGHPDQTYTSDHLPDATTTTYPPIIPTTPPSERDDPPLPDIRVPELDAPPTVPELDTPPDAEPETTGDPPIEPVRPDLPELPPVPEIPEPETESPPEGERPPAQDGPPGGEGDCCDRTLYDLATITERLMRIQQAIENLDLTVEPDDIEVALGGSGSATIDLTPCGAEESLEDAWEGNGLSGVYRGLEALSRAVEDIWGQVKCGDAVAIPEWWAVRPGADVPQLAITYKSAEGSSYWSLTIPHYNKTQDVIPQVPQYEKGSNFATLTLTDNTKLTVNAKTFEEGERVINALVPYIDPAYLNAPLNIHQGRRKGAALKEVKVVPTRGYFYATGQQDSRPDWMTDIQVV